MKKCGYCAKEITYFEQYCCDECHTKANRYYELTEHLGKLFSVVNCICVFGIPIGIFTFPFNNFTGTVIASVSCVILGLMLIILPFPTDNMISKYKLKKAIKITRIIGAAVIALGALIVLFMYLFLK